MSETTKKTFGKYEGISHLGSGAMGVVWKAQDPLLGRIVAVKTISAALGSDNENKERFLREARAAAQLNHPNIITVFEFGQADNELYMAMELLEGKDLKELITEGNLTFEQKLNIMEQMADGLAYAHSREVIHRDLKPGNVHVQPNGQVKILDFGLARLGAGSDLTKTGVVMGTPNYMSPEQVMGEKADARADVFSSGAVFYELLTGRKPFDAESVHATLYQVVHREPSPARQWDPRLPEAVVAIIETAMTKSTAGRYKDASALRDAIRAFRYGEVPELIVLDESTPEEIADAISSDATAIAPSAASLSGVGSGSAATYRSYGPSGSVAPSAGVTSQYGSARPNQSGPVPGSPPGPGESQIAPPPAPLSSNMAVKVGAGAGVLLLVALLGYFVAGRGAKEAPPSGVDTLAANLVETQLDLARRSFSDKDYKQAAEQVDRVLKLDPANPEALGLREQVESVSKEIETWVKVARDAVKRGDMASASSALGRVMARDPNHPAVAELSGDLNASFSARAEEARGEMEKARAQAEAKVGIVEEPAYAEAQAFVTAATQNMEAEQFTAAAQTFMEARDAFDRARRSLESLNADIARSRAPAPPTSAATPFGSTSQPVSPAGAPALPVESAPPATRPEVPEPTGVRDFGPGPTEVSGLSPQEFKGRFEFQVSPSPLRLGTPFRVQIYLRNEGAKDVSLTSLSATITRNGEASSPEAALIEDKVGTGKRLMIAEIPGRGSRLVSTGMRTWTMTVEAVSDKGERVRGSLAMKQP